MPVINHKENVLYIDNFKGFSYIQTDSNGNDHKCVYILNDSDWDDPDNNEYHFAEMMTFYIDSKNLTRVLVRGDLVIVNNDTQYRNDFTLIFDGSALEPLSFELDEYGSIPPDYKCFKDFSPRHWSIAHNSLRTFEIKDIKSPIFKKVKCEVDGVHETLHFVSFKFRGIEHLLISRDPFKETCIIQDYHIDLPENYISYIPEWLAQDPTRKVDNIWYEHTFEY